MHQVMVGTDLRWEKRREEKMAYLIVTAYYYYLLVVVVVPIERYPGILHGDGSSAAPVGQGKERLLAGYIYSVGP